MSDSAQKDFRQEPFVHITYDVERGNADSKREIPFVMGVFTDLMGSSSSLPPAAERKVTELGGGNFDQFMRKVNPKLTLRVKSTLKEGAELPVALDIKSMSDFTPLGVAEQVPDLKFLLEQRRLLKDLLAYMDGKSKAEAWLSDKLALDNHPQLKELVEAKKKELSEEPSNSGEEG